MKKYLDLTGKVALVTGASSGIGAATATVLADLGAKVAIGYFHNERGATEVCDAIVGAGGTAITVRADVRRVDAAAPLIEAVTAGLGPIDILVNNAGSLVKRQAIVDLTEEPWGGILTLNLNN